ncbi:hypothetical protein [Sediminibacillus halophilus]|uniref:Uncharacterized protein n=1 Tax=Sediminibacillus halophilus TaxID=482461 RepID=A0A1G9X8U7_9BACI|nr:hypothetical protein [Sediminibacillus halophilus]SDM93148.1 hypothetical protein SAMN05216244_3798 [Sediminibacillus halophilus]
MKAIFYLFVFAVIVFVNIGGFLPFLKVDEEDIGRNIKYLKRQQWFQNYLNDDNYRELIIHNNDVRQVIGKFKRNKLDKRTYQEKCQEKLHKVLLDNLNNIA